MKKALAPCYCAADSRYWRGNPREARAIRHKSQLTKALSRAPINKRRRSVPINSPGGTRQQQYYQRDATRRGTGRQRVHRQLAPLDTPIFASMTHRRRSDTIVRAK